MKLAHRKHKIVIEKGSNEVRTTEGIIRGVKDGDTYIFRGIRYASAKRFEKPERIPHFDGVKEAISYGFACPEYSTDIPSNIYRSHPYYTVQSEDCLYLNIWAKNITNSINNPVIVYFADKDYSTSYSVPYLEEKVREILSISNCVVITVYTRLNVLGYLDLSMLSSKCDENVYSKAKNIDDNNTSESLNNYEYTANLGLIDRNLALTWIRENASAFGGDPNDIHVHISKKADPLITIERSQEESAQMTKMLLDNLGIADDKDPIKALKQMRYETLADAAALVEKTISNGQGLKLSFSPVKNLSLCQGHPIIDTPNGKLRGAKEDSIFVFRGIKYANASRFHLPYPAKKWTGIKDALVYGPTCLEIETVNPDDNYTVPHVFYPQSEDCQYLNIWTQHLNNDSASLKPVMVWLHGGGFATGSGIEHFAYNGKAMCQSEDVVVVTLNHRLNVLGYLDLSAYGEEYKYSGNAGTADIVEALRWIQKNIKAFGGDPDNVTIFGQSGGGGKVAALLQTPSANGLFHKAVIQSGLADFHGKEADPVPVAQKLLKKLGISENEVYKLESIPYYELANALLSIDKRAGFAFGPTRDDDFYLGDVMDVGICDHARKIPVIVGNVLGEFSQNFVFTTDKEGSPCSKNNWTSEETREKIKEFFKNDYNTAIELQEKAYPDLPLANVLFTDSMFRPSSFDYLKLRASKGCHNTYGYMFCLEMPVYGGTLPWHNAEIPYVFHNADSIEPSYIPDITDKVEAYVCHCWCTFARTGNPGWDSYENDSHSIMYFDKECTVRDSLPEENLVRFLKSHPVSLTRITREQSPHLYGGGPRTTR